jgi:hypothetical protein
MIPATRNFGFENWQHAFVVLSLFVLAALFLTALYIFLLNMAKNG